MLPTSQDLFEGSCFSASCVSRFVGKPNEANAEQAIRSLVDLMVSKPDVAYLCCWCYEVSYIDLGCSPAKQEQRDMPGSYKNTTAQWCRS